MTLLPVVTLVSLSGAVSLANEEAYPTDMSWKKGEQSWGNEVVDKAGPAGPKDGIGLKSSCDSSQDLMVKRHSSWGNSGDNKAAFAMEITQNETEQSQGIEGTADTEPLVCFQGSAHKSSTGATTEEVNSPHVEQADDNSSRDKDGSPCGDEVGRKSGPTEQKDTQETDINISAIEHESSHQVNNLSKTTDQEDKYFKEKEQENEQQALILETSCHGVVVVESRPEMGCNVGSKTQLCFETTGKESGSW